MLGWLKIAFYCYNNHYLLPVFINNHLKMLHFDVFDALTHALYQQRGQQIDLARRSQYLRLEGTPSKHGPA